MDLLSVKTVMHQVDLKKYFNKLNTHQAKLKSLTTNRRSRLAKLQTTTIAMISTTMRVVVFLLVVRYFNFA